MRGLIYSSLAAAIILAMSGTAFAAEHGGGNNGNNGNGGGWHHGNGNGHNGNGNGGGGGGGGNGGGNNGGGNNGGGNNGGGDDDDPVVTPTGVTITDHISSTFNLDVDGNIKIDGDIDLNKLGVAVVKNYQSSTGIATSNERTENKSDISGSFGNASGNVGANVAAGDSNVQSNNVSLAAYDGDSADADATFLLSGRRGNHDDEDDSAAGGASAGRIFSVQESGGNLTSNKGHQNDAKIGLGSFANASGNVGVNMASGSGNVQANNLAATVTTGVMAVATTANGQVVSGNTTVNQSLTKTTALESKSVRLALQATGGYAGVGFETDDRSHSGHQDDRQQGGNHGDNNNGPDFVEVGLIGLSGTVSGNIPVLNTYASRDSFNHATISGGSFNNASGNIGVNVASGTNNLQANSLSLAAGFAE